MIEVNEYVRTKDGEIDRVHCNFNAENWRSKNTYGKLIVRCELDIILLENIVKHSKQLIDLIEEGDIIELDNDYKDRYQVIESSVGLSVYIIESDYYEKIENLKIQTILTKEQFEANCYKVGGEDE